LLVLLSVAGVLDVVDLLPLLVMPWTWGVVTGLGLVTWAYEGRTIRRWGERILGFLILVYLFVGVLAAEKLIGWLQALPPAIGEVVVSGLLLAHRYNPFSVMQFWLEPVQGWMAAHEAWPAWERMVWLEGLALATALVLLHRAAHRLKAHFRELHYAPLSIAAAADRDAVGDRPLSWWAVRRVMEYSGRVNLWLAGGFGVLYALFTLAGPHWPPWLGRSVFQLFNDRAGGIPAVAAALVVLAAVPAAFQYGLWDSNTQDRCRRLELLLLTQLEPRDYWDAAAAAAWRRGRGYFLVATLLWLADGLSRILAALDAHAPDVGVIVGREALRFGHAMAVATILWGLYFALGFRAFSRGLHANGLGSLLTLGVPLLAFVLTRVGGTFWGALMPPGAVYWAAAAGPTAATALGPCLAAGAALLLARHGLQQCDRELRAWYDRHHGAKVLD
ncbi:MAG: hypothetical protein NZ700_13245, partial [Gemmataceae bacterium]|nr:hypothetical protein [Gemmataceae bacterium]